MPKQLTLVACILFILWTWRLLSKSLPLRSWALWLPLIWLLIAGSRPVSFWFSPTGGGSDLEGSQIDRWIYLFIIIASTIVVSKRGFAFAGFISDNRWLFVFYAYLALTALWADYTFVTWRRCIKEVAALSMLLVVLTDDKPADAFVAICSRCALVLFPLSVVLIHYYPAYGRFYTHYGGSIIRGVTMQKNSLGQTILVFGLVLLWELLRSRDQTEGRSRLHSYIIAFLLLIGLYLLVICDSKTSLICLVLGGMVVGSHKLPGFAGNPKRFLTVFIGGLGGFLVLEQVFHFSDVLLGMIGRDSTFTQRTAIWEAIDQNPVNPLLGCGFMMYKDITGDFGAALGDTRVQYLSAHNGYIETHLDGGYIGVALLLLMLLSIGMRSARAFMQGSDWGRLAFAFFAAIVASNFSESIFTRNVPLWLVFLLTTLDVTQFTAHASKSIEFDPDNSQDIRNTFRVGG